jgi:hypothetical protein
LEFSANQHTYGIPIKVAKKIAPLEMHTNQLPKIYFGHTIRLLPTNRFIKMCEDLVSRKIAGNQKGEKGRKGGCYGKVFHKCNFRFVEYRFVAYFHLGCGNLFLSFSLDVISIPNDCFLESFAVSRDFASSS